MKRIIRLLMAMAITGAIAFSASGYVAAQDEGFTLGIQAAVCPENYAGPFVGCERQRPRRVSPVAPSSSPLDRPSPQRCSVRRQMDGC
jgi:hypothetical protein